MKIRARAAALLIASTAALVPTTVIGTAGPAAADNCEPTEPVVRVLFPQYEESIIQEQDNAFCYTMRGYVYPRICDNPTTLLGTCLSSLRPDPFEPLVIAPFSPDGGRIFCSLQSFALYTIGQSSTCTAAAPAGLDLTTEVTVPQLTEAS